MILNFRHNGLRRFYERHEQQRVPSEYAGKIQRILSNLNSAAGPHDMDLPGYRLHRLSGDLSRHWAVSVSANWRIIFRFESNDAYDVDLVDYH